MVDFTLGLGMVLIVGLLWLVALDVVLRRASKRLDRTIERAAREDTT